MEFICKKCNKYFDTGSGLYKHNKNYHPNLLVRENKTEKSNCKFCDKKLSNYISKWRHEKICKYGTKQNMMINKQNEISENLLNKINNLSQEIKNLKDKPTTINIHKTEVNSTNNNYIISKVLKINDKEVQVYNDYYLDANEICNKFDKSFKDWENTSLSNEIIAQTEQTTNISNDLLITKNLNNILIHPLIASQIFQWINPTYGIIFNNWLIDMKTNDKNNEINLLVNNFVKKHVRTEYPDKNVIYLLTTEFHKKNKTYIVGKAEDLAGRLSTYNKTCDHEVVYYKSCGEKEILGTVENMVLKKLNPYREVANRDRFILPHGKDISFFTDIIEQAIKFFNDGETTYIPKTNTKQKIINEIETLLDEINSKSYFAQPSV